MNLFLYRAVARFNPTTTALGTCKLSPLVFGLGYIVTQPVGSCTTTARLISTRLATSSHRFFTSSSSASCSHLPGLKLASFRSLRGPRLLKYSHTFFSSMPPGGFRPPADKNRSAVMLVVAAVVMVIGLSYAAVPLYRIYCQKTGKGGQAVLEANINEKVAALQKVPDRKLTIRFEAEKSARLAWDFKPSQTVLTVVPGETVLAFYTARNHLDRPVNGIATYTILPYEAGKYFNKIQCFCFEEQQLNAEEEVDLPVFFYIDPEYSRDPYLFESDDIVLSYNFFETRDGFQLPKPPSFRGHLPTVLPAEKKPLTSPNPVTAGPVVPA